MNSKISPSEIESNLSQFTGTEQLTRINNSLLTDGALYLAETCGAFWLIDIINSYQGEAKIKAEPFQTWTLIRINNNAFGVLADDGNGNEIAIQEISFSDFPLDKAVLWRVDGTIMLPSEY